MHPSAAQRGDPREQTMDNAKNLRHRILAAIRHAFALGWTTRLGYAARAYAAHLKARLVILRAAAV